MALAGSAQQRQDDVYKPNITIPAVLYLLAFGAGILLTVLFVSKNLT